jgi:phosphoribosyl-dephospho-CoA transferase
MNSFTQPFFNFLFFLLMGPIKAAAVFDRMKDQADRQLQQQLEKLDAEQRRQATKASRLQRKYVRVVALRELHAAAVPPMPSNPNK